ncbi:glycosyltransferase family 2 protein [Mammaliicoccus sciuri]|uniref:glycosyltransferase family 2 protein n=1 Tax=Mammaliicoccus sciuri TaxID=1296 RepID=UPI002DB8AD9E|nr:glycosyltransferase family 2 protein [Mammaliicoccus sciuri]MEB8131388.1 glycosyltransferase family 2 protein [Mammaliicoccus sciuri]
MEADVKKISVSVIIPYYKSYLTIDRTIKSILKQTRLPKEIIIIDDYSNTKEDFDKLQKLKKIIDVKVIKLDENKGPADARNKGMDISTGKYIAFIDSDDTWKKEKLESQFNIMERNEAYLSGHHSSIKGKKEIKSNKILNINGRKQLLKNRFPTRSVMVVNNNKYRFEEGKRYAEDFLLWTEIVLDNKKSIFINSTLANSYKEDFGENGLTKNLKNLYLGILEAYKSLNKMNKISKNTFYFLIFYQTLKFIVRNILVIKRKLLK